MRVSLPALRVVLFAAAAHAGDGRTEISQASVLAAGGFPYIISQSASYVLTSDLVVTDPDSDVIRVTTDDVSIDPGGHEIRGPSTCDGLSCTPAGNGSGIV